MTLTLVYYWESDIGRTYRGRAYWDETIFAVNRLIPPDVFESVLPKFLDEARKKYPDWEILSVEVWYKFEGGNHVYSVKVWGIPKRHYGAAYAGGVVVPWWGILLISIIIATLVGVVGYLIGHNQGVGDYGANVIGQLTGFAMMLFALGIGLVVLVAGLKRVFAMAE